MKKWIAALILISMFAGGAVFTTCAQDDKNKAPATKEAAGFEIARLVVATGVDNRIPVGIAETFPASTPSVICFLDAKNIAADTDITFVWIFNGKELLQTKLKLKAGSQWRTRADKNLRSQKGAWKVEVRDNSGTVIKEVSFKVE